MAASLQDDGIALSFADGCKGVVPFAEFPEVRDRASLSAIELPNPYEMILETVAGERIEIPWDFARHYCDESYRPTVEAIAMQGRQTDPWRAHPQPQGVCGLYPGGACTLSRHRPSYPYTG